MLFCIQLQCLFVSIMGKIKVVIGLFLTFLFLLGIMSGVVFATSGNWVEKGRLTGFAPKFGESPLFTIESNDWRIKWEYVPYAEYPNLTAFSIHVQTHAEVEGGPILPPSFREHEDLTYSLLVGSIIKSGTKETNGILYINGFNGTFVMDIVSNADSYVIIIEENLDVIPEFPSWTPLLITVVAVVAVTVIYRRRLSKSNNRGGNQ